MSRRRRHMETSEVALMAVMTKAMGAFLILMVFGMQYFVPDMTAEQISTIIQESLQRAKSDLAKIEKNLDKDSGTGNAASNSQTQIDIAAAIKRLDEAAADIERLRVRLDQAIAQLRHSEEERGRLSAENDQLKAELAKARALVASLQAQEAALKAERDKLAAQLQSLAQARQDLAQAANALNRGEVTKAEYDAIRKQVEAALASLKNAEAKIADLTAQLAAAQDMIKQLKDDNATLQKTVTDLTAERDKLQAEINARDTAVEFDLVTNKNCQPAKFGLIVTRLPPGEKGRNPIIQPSGTNLWSKIVLGSLKDNFHIDEASSYYTVDRSDMLKYIYVVKNVQINTTFAIFIYQTNRIIGDNTRCNLLVTADNPRVTGISYTFEFSSKDIAIHGPLVLVYDGNIAFVNKTDAEDNWLGDYLDKSKCAALSCDVHGKAYRADLHEVLNSRYEHDFVGPDQIDPNEKAAASKTLSDLIEQFGDDQVKLPDLERWVALLKTSAIPAKDQKIAPAQALSKLDLALMDERLAQADTPQIVIDRFKARALAGWWTEEDALARLETAKIAPMSAAFDAALDKKSLPKDPGGFADAARPMVESGTMTLAKGLDWVALMSTKADPAPGDPDPAALARTEDELRKKGLDQFFIAAVETAVKARNVRLEDVDRAVAQTEAAVP